MDLFVVPTVGASSPLRTDLGFRSGQGYERRQDEGRSTWEAPSKRLPATASSNAATNAAEATDEADDEKIYKPWTKQATPPKLLPLRSPGTSYADLFEALARAATLPGAERTRRASASCRACCEQLCVSPQIGADAVRTPRERNFGCGTRRGLADLFPDRVPTPWRQWQSSSVPLAQRHVRYWHLGTWLLRCTCPLMTERTSGEPRRVPLPARVRKVFLIDACG